MKASRTLLADLLRMEHFSPGAHTVSVPEVAPADFGKLACTPFDQFPAPDVKVRHFVRVRWHKNWPGAEVETSPGSGVFVGMPLDTWYGWREVT